MTATDPTNIPDPGAPQGLVADRIITPEALDALPVGSVWRTASGALGETITPRRGMARVRVEGIAHLTMTMGGDDFPLTLLHRPDRPSDLAAEVERLRSGIEGVLLRNWHTEACSLNDRCDCWKSDLRDLLLAGREADR